MLLLAGVATVSALVTGYLAYGYSTGWKGQLYSFWCPNRRRQPRTIRSPFYAKVDQESKTCVTDARQWMERYVRANLVSRHMKRKNRTGIVEADVGSSSVVPSPRSPAKNAISKSLSGVDDQSLEVPSP